LLVATWEAPEVETSGALQVMEDRAEDVLRALLHLPEVTLDPDVRPLNVLVAEMLIHTNDEVTKKLALAMGQYGGELTRIMTNAEALENVRMLDDRHAVLFNPGPFAGQPGSAQIARRYPAQHVSVSSLEKTRSRFLKKRPDAPKDRLIDVVRDYEGGAR
jgi:hypothetical protein